MPGIVRKLVAIAIGSALAVVPAGAFAAPAAVGTATGATGNPWLTLSAMTSSSSSAASAAALQGEEADGGIPILPLVVIVATIGLAIYIAVKDDDDALDFTGISPR